MTYTVDQAVDALTSAPEPTPAVEPNPVSEPAPDVAATEARTETPPADLSEGVEPGAEEPARSEEVEPLEPADPVVEPPHYWSKERKEAFNALPQELQVTLKEEWESGEKTHQQRMRDAAEARKQADAAAKEAKGLRDRITQAAEQAEAKFTNRWAAISDDAWLALSRDRPDDYTKLRAQYDAEQRILQQAQSAREEADARQRVDWDAEQAELLKTYAPALADPVTGEKGRQEVRDYLISQGANQQDLGDISAAVVALAYRAMLYDRGVAKIAQPQKPAPSRPAIKSAPAQQGSSQERTLQTAQSRLAKSGSIDDAVSVLMARKGH